MTGLDSRVFIQEVAPRDGFQIEAVWVDTNDKIALIDAVSTTGVAKIEVSSFVSPKAIPMLRDAAEVFAGIQRNLNVVYVALVPNRRGAERAVAANVDELNLVMSASETHNLANMRLTNAASLAQFREIVAMVEGAGVRLNGTVATAFGCPFEGPQAAERVLGFVKQYLEMGMQSITLADTTGMANPRQVADLVGEVLKLVPADALTLHFHNTRGMGLANVVGAYGAGARRFDAALGGTGGCPFAPGATGNICTEDLVNMFEEMSIPSGADLPALIEISRRLPGLLGHEMAGQIVKAGLNTELHAKPEFLQERLNN